MNRVLITGGTGSLGNALIKYLPKDEFQIGVYSRDEYKQRILMKDNPDVQYIVGDVRDARRLTEVARDFNIIIHAAALKHVPTGEESPEETIKTNILGTMNVIGAAKRGGVSKVVLISTDKGSHPVNLYGMTKAVSEKLMVAANDWNYLNGGCSFVCTRYGNVIGSRGSIIETLKATQPATVSITDDRMTRFWMSLEEAVKIVKHAIDFAVNGEIFVPKIRGMKISDMFRAVSPKTKLIHTGMRPGEKLHECLVNLDESMHTQDKDWYYVIEPEMKGVKYGEPFEYTSANAPQMTVEEFRQDYL